MSEYQNEEKLKEESHFRENVSVKSCTSFPVKGSGPCHNSSCLGKCAERKAELLTSSAN